MQGNITAKSGQRGVTSQNLLRKGSCRVVGYLKLLMLCVLTDSSNVDIEGLCGGDVNVDDGEACPQPGLRSAGPGPRRVHNGVAERDVPQLVHHLLVRLRSCREQALQFTKRKKNTSKIGPY